MNEEIKAFPIAALTFIFIIIITLIFVGLPIYAIVKAIESGSIILGIIALIIAYIIWS